MRIEKYLVALLFLSEASFGVVPPSYSLNDLYPDAKFMGAVTVLQGTARMNSRGEVCGMTYEAEIFSSSLGPKDGVKIKFHQLKDIRNNFDLAPLEIGSEYFIYTENRKTHRFVQLSDALVRFPEYEESCHAKENELYLYREFSGKVLEADGNRIVGDWGLRLIKEFREARSAYYSEAEYRVVIGKKSRLEQHQEKLHFQGYLLEDILNISKIHNKKSQQDSR